MPGPQLRGNNSFTGNHTNPRAGHARPLPGAVGVGVPDDPLPVYHSAKLTPSSTAFTSTSPS